MALLSPVLCALVWCFRKYLYRTVDVLDQKYFAYGRDFWTLIKMGFMPKVLHDDFADAFDDVPDRPQPLANYHYVCVWKYGPYEIYNDPQSEYYSNVWCLRLASTPKFLKPFLFLTFNFGELYEDGIQKLIVRYRVNVARWCPKLLEEMPVYSFRDGQMHEIPAAPL